MSDRINGAAARRSRLTWIVWKDSRNTGVLDAYPEERERYIRDLTRQKRQVVSEHAACEEAEQAAVDAFQTAEPKRRTGCVFLTGRVLAFGKPRRLYPCD